MTGSESPLAPVVAAARWPCQCKDVRLRQAGAQQQAAVGTGAASTTPTGTVPTTTAGTMASGSRPTGSWNHMQAEGFLQRRYAPRWS